MEAAGKLQKAGVIEYHRGKIAALDRERLETMSCECYDIVRKGTDRQTATSSTRPSRAPAGDSIFIPTTADTHFASMRAVTASTPLSTAPRAATAATTSRSCFTCEQPTLPSTQTATSGAILSTLMTRSSLMREKVRLFLCGVCSPANSARREGIGFGVEQNPGGDARTLLFLQEVRGRYEH